MHRQPWDCLPGKAVALDTILGHQSGLMPTASKYAVSYLLPRRANRDRHEQRQTGAPDRDANRKHNRQQSHPGQPETLASNKPHTCELFQEPIQERRSPRAHDTSPLDSLVDVTATANLWRLQTASSQWHGSDRAAYHAGNLHHSLAKRTQEDGKTNATGTTQTDEHKQPQSQPSNRGLWHQTVPPTSRACARTGHQNCASYLEGLCTNSEAQRPTTWDP